MLCDHNIRTVQHLFIIGGYSDYLNIYQKGKKILDHIILNSAFVSHGV